MRNSAPKFKGKIKREIANEAFLTKNNPGGRRTPAAGNAVPAQKDVNGRNLREEMIQALKAAGYNDSNVG